MRAPPNPDAAVRRFQAVGAVSLAIKVAAVVVLLFLVLRLFGGI